LLGQSADLLGVAADQDWVGHHAITVRQRDAALFADRQDRAHEVLVEPHAAGDAVHDDAELACCHAGPPRLLLAKLATGAPPSRRRQSALPPARRAAPPRPPDCRVTN